MSEVYVEDGTAIHARVDGALAKSIGDLPLATTQ